MSIFSFSSCGVTPLRAFKKFKPAIQNTASSNRALEKPSFGLSATLPRPNFSSGLSFAMEGLAGLAGLASLLILYSKKWKKENNNT